MRLRYHVFPVALLLAGCQSSTARHELRLQEPIIVTAGDQSRRAQDAGRLYPILVRMIEPWEMTVADDGSFVVTVTAPEGHVAWGHLEYIPVTPHHFPREPFDWSDYPNTVRLVITHTSDTDAAFWNEHRRPGVAPSILLTPGERDVSQIQR